MNTRQAILRSSRPQVTKNTQSRGKAEKKNEFQKGRMRPSRPQSHREKKLHEELRVLAERWKLNQVGLIKTSEGKLVEIMPSRPTFRQYTIFFIYVFIELSTGVSRLQLELKKFTMQEKKPKLKSIASYYFFNN